VRPVAEPLVCHLLDGKQGPYCGGRVSRESHKLFDCIVLGHVRCEDCIRVACEREKPQEPRVLVEAADA
jgi:hypothetical protein